MGICGGQQSGKSLVANQIKNAFGRRACLINLEDFYYPVRGNLRRRSSSIFGEEKLEQKQSAENDQVVGDPLIPQGAILKLSASVSEKCEVAQTPEQKMQVIKEIESV